MKILLPDKPTPTDLRRYFLFAAFKGEHGQEYMDREEILLGENPSQKFYTKATKLRQVDREGFLALDRAIDPWTKQNGGIVDKTYLFQCAPDNRADGCGHTNIRFDRNGSLAGEEQHCESCLDLTPYDKIPAILWDVETLSRSPGFGESQVELVLQFNHKAHYQVARGHARLSEEFVAEYLEYLGGVVTNAGNSEIGLFTVRIPLHDLHRMNGTDGLLARAEIKDFSGKAHDLVAMD